MADDGAAPRSGAPDYRWQGQKSGPASATSRGLSRGFWLVVLAGLFLAFLSMLIVWILFIKPPPPPPYYLSISIGEYNARPYPIVAFTRQDGERILRHFPAKNQAETKTRALLLKELKGLAQKSDPVIIHIAALALAREDKVFLLPGDADPGNESTWVDVRDVLDAVADCPAQHKLLILDIAHPLADPRLGVLTDRVAEALEEHLNKEKPRFFVLCPCSAGQYALTSEILQGSVLAYYLDQGLQGHADANKDARVNVRELFAFVEARVDRWAESNRASRQKPRLFGDAEDFVIVTVGKGSPGEMDKAELEPYPDRLQKGWQERDQWRAKEAFRRAPRMLRKLEATLMRQEKQWRGGVSQPTDLDSFDDDLQMQLKELARALNVPDVPQRSLALALAQTGAKKDPALMEAALNILANTKAVGAKKDVNAKVEEELLKGLKDAKNAEFAQQAWAVMEALHRVPLLKPEHFRVVREVLARLKPTQQYAELLYLQRLIGFADRQDADAWQPKKIQAVLQSARAREVVISALDREPALLPWLAGAIEEGDVLRRAGEKKLLWEGASTWEDAFEKLQSAKGKYDEALRAFEILQRARWHLDLAFAELPAYMHLLCDGPEADALAEQAWNKALQEAETLQTFFAAAPRKDRKGGKDLQESLDLDTPARELQRHLQTLDKTLRRRIDVEKKDDNAETLAQLLALLETPLLKAPERAALFAKQRTLAGKLNDANDEQDKDANRQSRIVPLPDAARKTGENPRDLARARMSLALLRLAADQAEKKRFVLPATTSNANSREWASLERKLGDAWSKDLVKQWRNGRSAFSGDALNRLVSPWELERFENDPSVRLQKTLRDSYRQWLQERCLSEAQFLVNEQEQPMRTFWTEAARELGP